MAVRNFYIDADIDGRKTYLRGGPASKHGGINLALYQRDEGCITEAVRIRCTELDGVLSTEVWINGVYADKYETRR